MSHGVIGAKQVFFLSWTGADKVICKGCFAPNKNTMIYLHDKEDEDAEEDYSDGNNEDQWQT